MLKLNHLIWHVRGIFSRFGQKKVVYFVARVILKRQLICRFCRFKPGGALVEIMNSMVLWLDCCDLMLIAENSVWKITIYWRPSSHIVCKGKVWSNVRVDVKRLTAYGDFWITCIQTGKQRTRTSCVSKGTWNKMSRYWSGYILPVSQVIFWFLPLWLWSQLHSAMEMIEKEKVWLCIWIRKEEVLVY